MTHEPSDAGDATVPSDAGNATVPSDAGDATVPSDAGDATVASDARDVSTGGRTPNRRRVLAGLGAGLAATGLPGCLGGGGGGEDQDPAFCSDLTDASYTRFDGAESPFVATFEYPGSIAMTSTINEDHSLTIRNSIGDGQPFDVFVTQKLEGTASPTAAETGDLDGLERDGELSFGGETVPIVRAEANNTGDDEVQYYKAYPYFVVGLPHEGSAGKRYYRFHVNATVGTADDLDPGDCDEQFLEVARHVVESLEPNPDTTVESAGP